MADNQLALPLTYTGHAEREARLRWPIVLKVQELVEQELRTLGVVLARDQLMQLRDTIRHAVLIAECELPDVPAILEQRVRVAWETEEEMRGQLATVRKELERVRGLSE